MPPVLAADMIIDPSQLDLRHERVPASQVVTGSPQVGSVELVADGGVRIGVWEITPGVVIDTEVDEVFVVLSGRAVVEFEESDSILHLHPGTIGRLAAGSRTRWTVTETLRKVYITDHPA